MRRVLALACILALGVCVVGLAQELSGTWDVDIDLDLQQTNFNDSISIASTIKVNYVIGDWTFASITLLDDTGWTDQDFSATGLLGAFTLTTAVDFNPDATFGALVMTVSAQFSGVLLGGQFTLEEDDTFATFTASGPSGDVDFSVSAEFGDDDGLCDFPFSEVTITVGLPFCCMEASASILVTCDGFDNVTFTAQKITIPNLLWLSLDAELVYALQTKSLTLTPVLDFGFTCVDFIMRLEPNDGINFETLFVDGIEITCDLGFATFTGLTYWRETSKPGLLAGTDYFEVYTIESNTDACCGPFSFETSVYFLEAGLKLFDVSRFDAGFEISILPQFTFDMGFVFDVETGLILEWTLGFSIVW